MLHHKSRSAAREENCAKRWHQLWHRRLAGGQTQARRLCHTLTAGTRIPSRSLLPSIIIALLLTLVFGFARPASAIDIPLIPWDWETTIQPVLPDGTPNGPPVPFVAWGSGIVRLPEPFNFDPSVQLVPGEIEVVPIEIVELSLTSTSPVTIEGVDFDVGINLDNAVAPSTGQMQISNVGGNTVIDTSFDFFLSMDFNDGTEIMTVRNFDAMTASMTFNFPGVPTPADFFVADTFGFWWSDAQPARDLFKLAPGDPLWDKLVTVHSTITPEPTTLALLALGGLMLTRRQRRMACKSQ